MQSKAHKRAQCIVYGFFSLLSFREALIAAAAAAAVAVAVFRRKRI